MILVALRTDVGTEVYTVFLKKKLKCGTDMYTFLFCVFAGCRYTGQLQDIGSHSETCGFRGFPSEASQVRVSFIKFYEYAV